MIISKLPYRRCVGCCIVNSENKVFVGQRVDSKTQAWQMPQGGIDDNESIEEAARREAFEETGIKSLEFVCESSKWHYYDLPEHFISKLWDGKYRGQKQKWVLFKFFGDDNEITLDLDQQEFREWKWVSFEDLPNLAISFKKRIYRNISKEFKASFYEKRN